MNEQRLTGASFPLTILVLGVAAYLTVGLVAMDVPDTASFPGPRFFPTIITVLAYLVTALLAVQSTRQFISDRRRRSAAEAAAPTGDDEPAGSAVAGETATGPAEDTTMNWRMIAIVVGSFIAFILLLDVIGWLLSAAILVFGVATGLGARSMFTSAFVALSMSAIVQLAFVGGLGLPLPSGFLGSF